MNFPHIIEGIARETWLIISEASPWLLVGFLVAGLLKELDLVSRFKRSFTGRNFRSILSTTLIGIPLPLCSCSVIPLIHTMKASGASRGATASFMTSTPQIGVDSYLLTQGLFGTPLALLRVFFAFISALATGILIERTPYEELNAPSTSTKSCCNSHTLMGIKQEDHKSFRTTLFGSLRFALIELPKELAGLLLLGFVLSGAISYALPSDFIGSHLGNPYQQIALATLFSVPIYVCATSSTPIAASLVLKGLSPAAALVFLLAGPATNISTMLIARKTLGNKGAFVYVIVIVMVSLLAGISIEALNSLVGLNVLDTHIHEHDHHSMLNSVSGFVISVLLIVPWASATFNKVFKKKSGSCCHEGHRH